MVFFFFFFSSRRRHTRWNCDWSSDVCSSDLDASGIERERASGEEPHHAAREVCVVMRVERLFARQQSDSVLVFIERSEERRVGKSVDLGGRRIIKKKKRKDRRHPLGVSRNTF